MARPPIKLTEQIQLRICEAIRRKASLQQSAQYAGISIQTLRRWIKRGQAETSGEFRQLYDAIEEAKAKLAMSLLLVINKAINMDWRAAAWLLERKFPKLYGRDAKEGQ